jgi:hypothetical protein
MTVVLGLTAVVYFPGLSGGFIFDDFSIIVEHKPIHVDSLQLDKWLQAAFSYPSHHQGRMLTMLSFAWNYYLTGLDPYWMKFTNLCIHLFNGVLLFFVLRTLFDLWRRTISSAAVVCNARIAWATLALCAAWLILPVNLTAVLYVSQRMESLSNTFVLLGLYVYLVSRIRHWQGQGGYIAMICGLVFCTGVGMFVKESALLLPLYAACVEIAITKLRTADGRRSRELVWLYVALLVVPAVLGILWFLSWVGGPTTYPRSFTVVERLMTEARVLIFYIIWTLVPLLDSLSLFHDDIVVSRGLFAPPTTVAAIIGLASLVLIALGLCRRRPLFALGIFWFFAGHVLTASVVPLELVFEHRNYFPSIGLLLAVGSVLALEPGLESSLVSRVISVLVIVFFASQTALAAREWSDPQRLAVAFATKHPNSPRAQQEYGRALLRKAGESSGDIALRHYRDIRRALEIASNLTPHDISSETMLIILAGRTNESVEERWWASIKEKLSHSKPLYVNIASLSKLVNCQIIEACPPQLDHLAQAFFIILGHPHSPPKLLASYARFAAYQLNDPPLAERMYREVLEFEPSYTGVRTELIVHLIRQGHLESAQSELETLRRHDRFGMIEETIQALERAVESAGSAGAASFMP